MFLSHLPDNPKAKERYAKIQAQLDGYASAGTQVELCFPDDYPGAKLSSSLGARNEVPGIYHVLQTPAIIRKIVWAENNGYDAVVQSNAFNPGVEAARQTVRIPVIGVFRTALHVASVLLRTRWRWWHCSSRRARRISMADCLLLQHVQGFVKDIAAIGLYDETAEKRIDAIFARATEVMRATIKTSGAGCIIPLGGAVIPTLVYSMDLEREVGVPVRNTKAIGIRFAEMCVQLGITQSALNYPLAQLRYEDFTAFAR